MQGVSSLQGKWLRLGYFPLITLLVITGDQLAKKWVTTILMPSPFFDELLVFGGWLRFIYATNKGVVFGFLLPQGIILTLSILVIIAALFLVYRYSNSLLPVSASALLLGGTIGNLIDRVRFGWVIDFIDIRLFGGFHWPVFNLADSAIVLGVILLAYFFLQPKKHLKGG